MPRLEMTELNGASNSGRVKELSSQKKAKSLEQRYIDLLEEKIARLEASQTPPNEQYNETGKDGLVCNYLSPTITDDGSANICLTC